jgi:hypothetical protein
MMDLEKICEGIGIMRTILGQLSPNSLPDGNFVAQIFNIDAPIFVKVVTLVELIQFVRANLTSLQRMNNSENAMYHPVQNEETRMELKNQFQNWAEKVSAALDATISDTRRKIKIPTVSVFLTNKEVDKTAAKRWLRNFGLTLLLELMTFIREVNFQANKAKCKKAQLHLPKRRGRHGGHYKGQDEDNDSLSGSRYAKNKLDILYTHGALGMKQFFSRWGFKDKDLPIELNTNIISNHAADTNEHLEPNRKSLNMKRLRQSSLDHTPKGSTQSFINLSGHFLSDFCFDCDHENEECFSDCYVATRRVTETLGSLVLLLQSDQFLNKFDGLSANPASAKPSIQESHGIIEKVPVACLNILLESIHEISSATMQLAVYPCWKIISIRNDKASKLAAVFILLACHRLKETIPEFLKLCLEKDPPIELLSKIEVLWNMRSHVWAHVDKRLVRHFKLPSLAVNIALPNPMLGSYPEDAPDAPWMNEYNDFDKLYADGIINVDLLKSKTSATKKSEQEKSNKKEQEVKLQQRQNYPLTNLSIQDSINQHYVRSVGSMDDEDEGSRRFSSRLMSITSMGTLVDDSNLTDSGNEINVEFQDRSHHAKDDVPIQVFPGPLQNILPKLFHLVNSSEIHKNIPVNFIAKDIFKKFLTEDCFLLLRSVTEKILSREHTSAEPVTLIYDLIVAVGGSKGSWNLSAQTTKTIANYIVGLMTMITRNGEDLERHRSEQLILILQHVIPNIEGVTLKQLKATFKKENCKISLFSVVYGAKKLTCFGPHDHMIPNQIEIGSEVKFKDILEEGIEFYSLAPTPGNVLCLQDRSKNRLLNPNIYVRDYFIFKKGEIPQVTIVEVPAARAEKEINALSVNHFNDEIAKVFVVNEIITSSREKESEALFLKSELLRMVMFPRRVMGSDSHDRISKQLDGMKKFFWMDLISNIFDNIDPLNWEMELVSFLDILCCAFISHHENTFILKKFITCLVSASIRFPEKFLEYCRLHILDSVIRVYILRFNCKTTRNAIEFMCRNLYIIHRVPFIMQLLSAFADLFNADAATKKQLTPKILASLINSINSSSPSGESYFLDKISTETLDTIYLSESESFQIFDALNLCQILILEWSDKTSITKMFLLLDILVDVELYELKQQLKKFSKVSLPLLTKLKKVSEVVENIALESHCFESKTSIATSKRGNRMAKEDRDDESEPVESNASTECILPRQTYLKVVLKINAVSKEALSSTKFDDENFSKRFNEKLLEIVFFILKTPVDEIEINVNMNQQKQSYRQISETLGDYFSVMFPQLDWRVKEMRAGLTGFLKAEIFVVFKIIQFL